DRNLPDLDALELAEMIRKRYPRVMVELVDSRVKERDESHEIRMQDVEMRDESRDVPRFGVVVGRERTVAREGCTLEAGPAARLPGMIGTGAAIQQVYRLSRMVAGRDTTVLVTGETGTGKELVAKAIHELSPRARQHFVVVNCAAIPEALLEAELFGHARG